MEDTGRIRQALNWRAREILFGPAVEAVARQELEFYVRIDRACAVMLVERHLLPPAWGQKVLAALQEIEDQQFAPLWGRPAQRGLYLLYEHYLTEILGEEMGGAVHLGRSRNDINATIFHLRLRLEYRAITRELLRLIAVLIRRAERYARLMMPIYTHYQAALPVTFGHYLAGITLAILRDLEALENAADLDRCPLGAGAAGGTTVPIDSERLARWLGFSKPVLHSIDAVASRDSALRILAAGSVLGVTLSRLATDLQLWSTEEFSFVRFPDSLVGSSSMMPQKRNVFLLEHVQGRTGAALGAFTSAVVSMHSTPFTNSIAVGTEGVKPLWNALRELTGAVVLVRLVVAGAEPRPEHMRRRAVEGFITATEMATRLALETGISFRQAHFRIGRMATAAASRLDMEDGDCERCGRPRSEDMVDPASVAAAAAYGGGPAPVALAHILAKLRRRWAGAARRLSARTRYWCEADRKLRAAVKNVRSGVSGSVTLTRGA